MKERCRGGKCDLRRGVVRHERSVPLLYSKTFDERPSSRQIITPSFKTTWLEAHFILVSCKSIPHERLPLPSSHFCILFRMVVRQITLYCRGREEECCADKIYHSLHKELELRVNFLTIPTSANKQMCWYSTANF